MPAPEENHHQIKEWIKHVLTYAPKKRFTETQLDSFADAVKIIIQKENCSETINLLKQFIDDLQKAKASIKVIERWERKLQMYENMYAYYASADALAVALEQAGVNPY